MWFGLGFKFGDMVMEKFTKGPWEARTGNLSGVPFALVYVDGGGFDLSGAPDAIANAHLIACAPDMYRFLDDIANGRGTDYPIEQLLSKARGE